MRFFDLVIDFIDLFYFSNQFYAQFVKSLEMFKRKSNYINIVNRLLHNLSKVRKELTLGKSRSHKHKF